MMRRFAIALFACRSRQDDGCEIGAEAALDPAAETLGKIIGDPESASRGAPRRPPRPG